MKSQRINLQDALKNEARRVETIPEQVVTTLVDKKQYKQPGRAGKVNITGYFAPAVKSSFRMIQIQHPERTIQDLLAEALNDLFAKYNVPQTAHLDK
jgi:hypothetical protein